MITSPPPSPSKGSVITVVPTGRITLSPASRQILVPGPAGISFVPSSYVILVSVGSLYVLPSPPAVSYTHLTLPTKA